MAVTAEVQGPAGAAHRADWARRYPPVVAVIVGIALAVAVLPSALNLPQSNPTETAEYAPVPPVDRNTPPPPGGNFSSLGLASSGTTSEVVQNGDTAGGNQSADSGPLSRGLQPSTFRCVGRPPRQTEDPLAPPCVPYFKGDNFGSTYVGVTGTEIRMIIFLEGPNCYNNTGESGHGVQATRPSDVYYDFDRPPDSSSSDPANNPENKSDYAPGYRAMVRYFNDRYQLFGRHLHVRLWHSHRAKSGSCESPDEKAADAAEQYDAFHPFAVIDNSSGNAQAYDQYMAEHGVVNFIAQNPLVVQAKVGHPAADFQLYPGLTWSYLPTMESNAAYYASVVCRELVPYPVSYSGNSADMGKPRKFGMVRSNDKSFPGFRQLADLEAKYLQDTCGVTITDFEDIPVAGYDVDETGGGSPAYAQNAMLKFQKDGVTTVIWGSGADDYTSKSANNIQYYPEWLLSGDYKMEGHGDASVQSPAVWRHVRVVSTVVRIPARLDELCFQAYSEGAANPQPPGTFEASVACSGYPDLRLAVTGIQIAGPRLTPDNMDQGFHHIPHVSLNSTLVPTCYFNTGDYTCTKDAELQYWDQAATDPDGGAGCWRMIDNGRRYLEGNWPARDLGKSAQGNEVCNNF